MKAVRHLTAHFDHQECDKLYSVLQLKDAEFVKNYAAVKSTVSRDGQVNYFISKALLVSNA